MRAKPNLCTPDVTIKYISRYLGRPVIAASQIDQYDGDFVTFHYTRHEDHKTIVEHVPAMQFIKRLIIHIPEKHFKRLRYYGIYAKHHKQEKKLRKCISPEKKSFLKRTLDWRNSILLSFGYDPLRCEKRESHQDNTNSSYDTTTTLRNISMEDFIEQTKSKRK